MAYTVDNGTALVPTKPAIIRFVDGEGKNNDIIKMNIKRVLPGRFHAAPLPTNYSEIALGDPTQTAVAKVILEMVDDDNIEIDLTRVTNQPGWTVDLAGIQQAVDDISVWISDTLGTSGAAILTLIYNEIKDDTDDEYILYRDSGNGTFAVGMWSTEDGGAPVISYLDFTGAPYVPAGTMEPIKGRIGLNTAERWIAIRSDGIDKLFTEGDVVEERILTFYSVTGGSSIVLDRIYYRSGGTLPPGILTFASYGSVIPPFHFRQENYTPSMPGPTITYEFPIAGSPQVFRPGWTDSWIAVHSPKMAKIEMVGPVGYELPNNEGGVFTVASAPSQPKLNKGDVLYLVGEQAMTNWAVYDDNTTAVIFNVTFYQ